MGNTNTIPGNIKGMGGGSPLLLDNAVFSQKQKNLQGKWGQLIFDKNGFAMENSVCGTDSMVLLADLWHGASDSSDKLKTFLSTDVDKATTDIQTSIIKTDDIVSRSFSLDNTRYKATRGPIVVPDMKNTTMTFMTTTRGNVTPVNADLGLMFSQFSSLYSIDQETMDIIADYIENYDAKDPQVIKKLKEYQNLSADEWENLSDEQYKEFTALTALYVLSAQVVEQGDTTVPNYDTYFDICKQMTSNMYSIKPLDEGSEYVEASADPAMIFSMKTAMESMGMSDSLAYNIATKVENDSNSYLVYDSQYQPNPKDVRVYITYDESGFVSVDIEDSYVTDYPLHTNQFLATSRDHASEHMQSQREGISNYSNHGMTDEELIGMYQSVENPNDLQIMDNIIKSDADFNVDGKNAFDIDYWEYDTSYTWNYSRGVSDPYSVALAQMGATMLYKNDTESYKKYLNAALQSSVNGSDHNIMLDIASGAGVYADTCSLAVVNDTPDHAGGGNDYTLHMQLNAANANFGAFSQMYEKFDYDTDYSNVNFGNITYDDLTGDINFNITADSDKTSWFFFHDKEEGKTFTIDSTIESGKEAIDDYAEGKQAELKKELQRKRDELVVDTVIDLTGCINPYLKDGIYFVKDAAADKDVSLRSANLVKDGIQAACKDSKKFNRGVSGVVTIFGAISKYNSMMADYEKAKENYNNIEKLDLFYNYNTGAGAVGLYDYQTIRKIQEWNDNGIVEILGENCEMTNEQIYSSLMQNGALKNDVLETIASDLCDQSFDELNNNPSADVIADTYATIADESGYTKEEIYNAINVLVYGQSATGEYHVVTDIPFELQHACLDALKDGGSDINVYSAWETYYNNR